jgi:hypothetical protein
MLQLHERRDFYIILFKIQHRLYTASGSATPPRPRPQWKILHATPTRPPTVSYPMGSGGGRLAIHLRLTPRLSTVWSCISTPPHIFVEWLIKHGNNFTSTMPKDIFNSRTRRFITSSTKVRHWARSPFFHTLSLRSGHLLLFALTWNRSTIRWTSSP